MKKFLKEWEWFSFKDYRHLPVFIGFIVLLLGLTIAITLATNATSGGQSGASYQKCVPLPPCYASNRCPEIINYRIPNMRWCLPSPTPSMFPVPTPGVFPTPGQRGCYYVQGVCPLTACRQGYPCPTCPPRLICPSPVPTATPVIKPTFTPVPVHTLVPRPRVNPY